MKNIKYILKIGLLSLSLIMLQGCSYGDLNVDPGRVDGKKVSTSVLLAQSLAGFSYVYGSDLSRYNALFTQHIAGTARQHQSIGQNSFPDSYSNAIFNFVYASILPDLRLLVSKTSEKGLEQPLYRGISNMMIAFSLCVVSDIIGDIPYSDAFTNDNPKYDTQEEIMKTVISLLQSAITDINQSDNPGGSPSKDDFFYGGDKDKWSKAAYTLLARVYLQTRLRNTGNTQLALDAIGKGIASSDGDMKFPFTTVTTEQNPWRQWAVGRSDTRIGKFFVDLMKDNGKGVADPRLSAFATKDGDGNYVGSPHGSDGDSNASDVGSFIAAADAPVYILTYTEAKFIEAEAQFILGDKDKAAAALNEAIKSSVKVVTGRNNDAYEKANTYDASVTLNDIITHKYIALFGNYVTYNDWRRTNLPALTPVPGFLNGVRFILSWPYPQSEIDLNDNIPANNGNFDKIKTKVWWQAN